MRELILSADVTVGGFMADVDDRLEPTTQTRALTHELKRTVAGLVAAGVVDELLAEGEPRRDRTRPRRRRRADGPRGTVALAYRVPR